jgi:hypothetical protein
VSSLGVSPTAKAREDDTTACEFSCDNGDVVFVFDIMESRQRGIVVTLANDIDESVKLSLGDGDRIELAVV